MGPTLRTIQTLQKRGFEHQTLPFENGRIGVAETGRPKMVPAGNLIPMRLPDLEVDGCDSETSEVRILSEPRETGSTLQPEAARGSLARPPQYLLIFTPKDNAIPGSVRLKGLLKDAARRRGMICVEHLEIEREDHAAVKAVLKRCGAGTINKGNSEHYDRSAMDIASNAGAERSKVERFESAVLLKKKPKRPAYGAPFFSGFQESGTTA
jgi:hypothetical protein